ncbi:MAG: helix-turn-helix transcriptional regulator [Candidatus Omnitrophica bacterium]|nr:helix-turn-helix transcriptional regulator [Candidatus Omnitrophota bacterium]
MGLKKAIYEAGLTVKKAAELIGLSRTALFNILMKKNKPSAQTFIKLKKIFPNLKYEDFFEDEHEKNC